MLALLLALALAIALTMRLARPLSLYLAHLGLRPMLRDFDAICAAHGVVYWADSGTLLGAVRDGGIIAHDDDIDVCVPAASMQALCDAVREGPDYAVWAEDYCYKFGKIGVPEIWIDVFPVALDEDGRVGPVNELARRTWPTGFYVAEELFPLRRAPFDGGGIWVPRDPLPYLARMYGDWRSPVVYARH